MGIELPKTNQPRVDRPFGRVDLGELYNQIDITEFESDFARGMQGVGLTAIAIGEVSRRKMPDGVRKALVVGLSWGAGGVLVAVGEAVHRGARINRGLAEDEAFIRMQEAINGRWQELRHVLDTYMPGRSENAMKRSRSVPIEDTKVRVVSMGLEAPVEEGY